MNRFVDSVKGFTLFALFFALLAGRTTEAQVVINEFMASNNSIYADIWDFGDFADWIELQNTTSANVDLSGWYLSDNLNNLKKWPIPSGTTIPAGGFLVIFADGNDTKPGQQFTRDFYPWTNKFTTKYYHTNFNLSSDGDAIALSKSSGTDAIIVDSVKFPNQLGDVSCGRNPSDNKWYLYDQPTPGAVNTADGKPLSLQLVSGSVTASVPGGFYASAQTITLTAASGEIYYTLDGSFPSKSSTKYTAPVSITKSTTLRARIVESDKLAGKILTNTYFVNEKARKLMCVNISTDTTYLYDKDKGIFKNSLKNREVPVAVEFFTTEGKEIVKVNAGMKLGSLTNFTCAQKPLQVALKGKYGDDFIWNQLYGAKQEACFSSFRLRQGGDAWNSNLIADGLLESITNDHHLEVGIQAYRPVVLFINGQYYGIQDLREQFDDQYFMNNYNVDPTTKNEVRTTLLPPNTKEGWELVSGPSFDERTSLIQLVNGGTVDDAKYSQVKSIININSMIDYVCLQEFGANISWGHNEDMWKIDKTKWQWLVTDFDRCFVYKDLTTDVLVAGGNGLSGPMIKQDTLFKGLLTNTEFKNYFIQRFAAHLNSTFKASRLEAYIDSLVTLITPEMDDYTAKWGPQGGVKSITAWKSSVDSVKKFIDGRAVEVINHLSKSNFNTAGTASLTIAFSSPGAGMIYINDVPMTEGLTAMTFFKNIPMKIRAVANPGYVFSGWQGGSTTDTMTITLTGDQTLTANFTAGGQHTVPTTIAINTTLNLTDAPYAASGDIDVPAGVTLTIEKGVTLLMKQDNDITVEGKLLINGTADAHVTIKTNATAGATNWGAITFTNAADTNRISYLDLSGTTLGNDALNERGGVNSNNSNLIMDHITASNVIYPFYIEGGSVALRNSGITIDHICNGGIHTGRCNAIVENNTWVSTGKTMNTDAIDVKGVVDGIVRCNRLYNFNGSNSDGIDLGEGCKNVLVEGNYIYGNRDKGISCGGASTCTVRNNIIVACDLGIGIKDEGSTANLDHNTFVRNRIGVAAYTKVFGRGGGVATVKNCIFSGQKISSIFKDSASSVTVSYSISDVDVIPGTGNIFGDPLFTDLCNNNFQLQQGSPCINTGDPASPRDQDNSVIDIGAPYTFNSIDFPANIAAPFTPTVIINEIMNSDSKNVQSGDWLELYNPTGIDIPIGNWKMCDKGTFSNWEITTGIADLDSQDVFVFPANSVLKANGYLVVCKQLDSFKVAYPNVTNSIGNLSFALGKKDTVYLYNGNNSLINLVAYSSDSPWPKADKGLSIGVRFPNNLNWLPLNWAVSKKGSTPGAANGLDPVIPRAFKNNLPNRFLLDQNFPNPFRMKTTIRFALPVNQKVSVKIYNISGRLVETIVDRKQLPAGFHSIMWDARKYPSGIYFYNIKTETFKQTRTLTVR